MKRRIGNDIPVEITVLRNGEPEDMSVLKSLDVIIKSASCEVVPFAYIAEGNVLKGVFYGKDQRRTGKYIIELVENGGERGMASLDADLVTLVDRTCKEKIEEGCLCLEMNHEPLDGEVTASFSLVRDGLSAYELAVIDGFEGTVSEWLASLKGEPGTPADMSRVEALEDRADKTEIDLAGVIGRTSGIERKGDELLIEGNMSVGGTVKSQKLKADDLIVGGESLLSSLLPSKADASDTYRKSMVDSMLESKTDKMEYNPFKKDTQNRLSSLEGKTSGIKVDNGVTSVDGVGIKALSESVPKKVSQLVNDKSYITAATSALVNYYLKGETYTKTEVNRLISEFTKFGIKVVQVLPAPSKDTLNTIYLVPAPTEREFDIKDEYITIVGDEGYVWEKIGSTAIDVPVFVCRYDDEDKYIDIKSAAQSGKAVFCYKDYNLFTLTDFEYGEETDFIKFTRTADGKIEFVTVDFWDNWGFGEETVGVPDNVVLFEDNFVIGKTMYLSGEVDGNTFYPAKARVIGPEDEQTLVIE